MSPPTLTHKIITVCYQAHIPTELITVSPCTIYFYTDFRIQSRTRLRNRKEKRMKKNPVSLLLPFAVVCVLFLGISSAEAVTTSKWYTDPASFESIEQAAKKKNKPYILFFYTDWCGYCKKMNKKYLSDTKVKQVLSRYYRIKINPDDGEKEYALAQEKGVTGYPDFRVVHPDGRSIEIHPFRKGESLKVKSFIKYLKAALNG